MVCLLVVSYQPTIGTENIKLIASPVAMALSNRAPVLILKLTVDVVTNVTLISFHEAPLSNQVFVPLYNCSSSLSAVADPPACLAVSISLESGIVKVRVAPLPGAPV